MQKPAINLKKGDFITGVGVVQSVRVFFAPVARPGANWPREEPDLPAMLEVNETWTADQVDTAVADCYAQRPSSIHAEGHSFIRRYRTEDMVQLCSLSKKKRKIA